MKRIIFAAMLGVVALVAKAQEPVTNAFLDLERQGIVNEAESVMRGKTATFKFVIKY